MKRIIDENFTIRSLEESDLIPLWEISYRNPEAEWLKWNGPYFNSPIPTKEAFLESYQSEVGTSSMCLIDYQAQIIGLVTYYFKDNDLKRWLDVGLVIYREDLWGKGIGECVLKEWITYLFESETTLPHIGFTTWSGNVGMMKIGEKLGMKQEACFRSVRYWQGQYWDSISYGILREEWAEIHNNRE